MNTDIQFKSITSEEKDGGQRVEVEVVAHAADVDRLMDEFYQLLGKLRGVKADDPRDTQANLLGIINVTDLEVAMRDYLLNRFTIAAVKQLDIDTVLAPGVHAEDIPERGKDYAYAMNLVPRPQMSLTSYDPVTVAIEGVRVTDQDIDDQVQFAARQTLTYERAEHRDLREGDFAVMDVEMFVNGQKLNKLSGSRMRIEIAQGKLPDGFIEGVVGMKPHDIRKLKFDVEVPLAKEDEDRFDHYKADVVLQDIQRQVIPEVDDEWVKANVPEFGDLAGFRASIRKELEEQKGKVDDQAYVLAIREALEKRLVGTIPDLMYEEAKDSFMRRTMEQLDEQELSVDEYCEKHGIEKATFNMNMFMQASAYLRQNLALDELAKGRGIEATEEDIREARKTLNPAMARLSDQEFADRGYKKSLAENIRRRKAMAWLMETATVE